MPHREVQAMVEKMYGVARLIETSRDDDADHPVFVFEVRSTTGARRVKGWRTNGSIVTDAAPASPPPPRGRNDR